MNHRLSDTVKLKATGQWDSVLQGTCGLTEKETTPTKKGIPCPNCGGHDRYEYKSSENGFYMCRGCGAGDGFSLVMKMRGCTFSDAVKVVAGFLGLDTGVHTMSRSISEKLAQKRIKEEEKRLATQAVKQAVAARIAAVRFETATVFDPDHPYLKAKRIQGDEGIRQENDCLLIPARNSEGRITSLQSIDSSGQKRFQPDGKIKGSFHLIGEVGDVVYIVEGYATAASLYQIKKEAVVVSFFASNLAAVVLAIRDKYPDSRIIIAADNDRFTPGNPGLTKAKLAAAAIRAEVLVPPFAEREPGTDWNDWINNRRGML